MPNGDETDENRRTYLLARSHAEKGMFVPWCPNLKGAPCRTLHWEGGDWYRCEDCGLRVVVGPYDNRMVVQ